MATGPVPPIINPDEVPGSVRRINLRRNNFSRGTSTSAEGHPDEVIDADLHAETLQSMANPPPTPLLPPPQRSAPDEDGGVRQMLAEAVMAGDAEYARSYRQQLVYKMRLRGVTISTIAREMGVSIATIKNDVAAMKEALRREASALNVYDIVGEQNAFYEEATQLAMRIVSAPNTPQAMRLAGLRTALSARADKARFLSTAGVFDVLAFRRGSEGDEISDVQLLMDRTEAALEALVAAAKQPPQEEAEEVQEPAKKARPRVLRRGGFKPMSFDDRDASSSANEEQAL